VSSNKVEQLEILKRLQEPKSIATTDEDRVSPPEFTTEAGSYVSRYYLHIDRPQGCLHYLGITLWIEGGLREEQQSVTASHGVRDRLKRMI
jgi:hypothetical protein